MRKRIFSILLALCMVLCLVLTAAFAEGKAEETPVCTCETACTAEAVNADCPICGAEGALAENCGKYAAEESGQTGTSNDAPTITAVFCQSTLCAADRALCVHCFRRTSRFAGAYRCFLRLTLGKCRGRHKAEHHAQSEQDAE